MQNGHGIEHWIDGSIYEGEFKNGKKHGIGHFTWSDGSSYEGQFVEKIGRAHV